MPKSTALTATEVTQLVPGITRDNLAYWRRRGFVETMKVGKKPTYLYPATELPKIREMTQLIRFGASPQSAHMTVLVYPKGITRQAEQIKEMIQEGYSIREAYMAACVTLRTRNPEEISYQDNVINELKEALKPLKEFMLKYDL